jgi:hypothetical protein
MRASSAARPVASKSPEPTSTRTGMPAARCRQGPDTHIGYPCRTG